MSLEQLAQHVQSRGRGNDKMLIHMTPSEVGGLQALAKAHGGSLTINPDTGLPEAGFLEKILPTVIGAGVGIATMNPMLGAAAGGAAGMAMNKGSLQAGIMAGLSSYGIGSLGVGIAGAGAAATSTAGALGQTSLAGAVDAGLMTTGGTLTDAGVAAMDIGGASTVTDLAPEAMGNVASSSAINPVVNTPSTWDNLRTGFSTIGESPQGWGGFLKNNAFSLGMGAMPLLINPTDQQNQNQQGEAEGEIRPYTFTRTQNPNFGMPGQPYFNQSFTAGTPVAASDFTGFNNGGIVALADGGVSGPYTRPTRTVDPAVTEYNQKLMQQAQQEYVNSPQLGAFHSAIPNAGVFNQQAADAYQTLQNKQAADRAANPPQPGIGGYVFDQATGRFSKPDVAPEEPTNVGQQGMSDWDLLQRYGYNPYSTSGGGAASGGVMPNDLRYASGGGIRDLPSSHLGDYSDGGRLLKGPGDGVSDDIPAQIGEKQPARLADGEFVVPARIVSEIGNGSTDAGAKRLYQMMDRVQKARKKSVGKGKVAVDSKAYKHLPV